MFVFDVYLNSLICAPHRYWEVQEDFENWTMSLDISFNNVESEYVKKQKCMKIKLTPRTPSPSRPLSFMLTSTNKQTLMLVSFSELM